MNPYKDSEEDTFVSAPRFTYEDIATKLLRDNYFLTALELHTELVENGKELPQLREFFSNPGNFEQHVSHSSDFKTIQRTPSQATLDSLDTTRYSEDGGGDRAGSGGDVAVLEFELRKARETINSLRANLTQFADGDSLDKNTKPDSNVHILKPHEKKALNFLINEYLLLQDYKLTSITFSDENPDQDFEDWDDIGLNIPRPSGLGSLLYGDKASLHVRTCDASTDMELNFVESDSQTVVLDESNVAHIQHDDDGDWHHELLIQAEEIRLLKEKINTLEMEKLNFQKLYDAAIVSLNSLTTPSSETKCLDLKIPQDKLEAVRAGLLETPLTLTAAVNHYGSNPHSMHSTTPDQFELIDNEKHSINRKEGSNSSSFEPAIVGMSARASITSGDTLSLNDAGDWTRLHYDSPPENSAKDMWIDSGLPNNLKTYLLNWCNEALSANDTNELLSELVNCDKSVTLEMLLSIVADTIPKVIPHMLVGRRCEMTPLLVVTIRLLSNDTDSTRRAKLLHQLLTLKKSLDAVETRIICEAARLIVKWGNGGEVLSCIAEVLSSRTTERRVVASQICVAIAPYVSVELSTSLLLSLVLLMCESSEVEIRCLGLKAACVISAVAEHKYSQLENLLFTFLSDSSDILVKDAILMFVPVLARTALIAGKFSTDLVNRLMTNLIKMSDEKEWKQVLTYLNVLHTLRLVKLAFVLNVQNTKDINPSVCDRNYQEISLENVQDTNSKLDVQCFVVDKKCEVKALVSAMNYFIREKPDVRWAELNWFISLIKQILDISINHKYFNYSSVYEEVITIINSYVVTFGAVFTCDILKPIFLDIINDLEYKMEKLHSVAIENTIVVGIYCATVLPAAETNEDCLSFLHKWIVYCSLRNVPVKMLSVPLKWINKFRNESLNIYLQLLTELCVENEEGSASAIRLYSSAILTELLASTEVDVSVLLDCVLPAVNTMLHDSDATIRESAIVLWGSMSCCANTPSYWNTLSNSMSQCNSAKEAARAADVLAVILVPSGTQHSHYNEAVTLLCSVCARAPLTPECVTSLVHALQLAALHPQAHSLLRPALKRLEEAVQSPSLVQHKSAVEGLIYNIAGTPTGNAMLDFSPNNQQKTPTTNLQAAQEVGRRVTQMFQQSKSNMNLQSIFKKKT